MHPDRAVIRPINARDKAGTTIFLRPVRIARATSDKLSALLIRKITVSQEIIILSGWFGARSSESVLDDRGSVLQGNKDEISAGVWKKIYQ